MSRDVLRIGAIALLIAGVGFALLAREVLTPVPPAGPLALVEPQPGGPQARTEGVLEIDEECVRLVHPDGSSSLVIWSLDSATWDATDRSIAVSTPDGDHLTLRSGDALAFSGGGGPAATLESAGSWVRRPGETCTAPEWFIVVDVHLAEQD